MSLGGGTSCISGGGSLAAWRMHGGGRGHCLSPVSSPPSLPRIAREFCLFLKRELKALLGHKRQKGGNAWPFVFVRIRQAIWRDRGRDREDRLREKEECMEMWGDQVVMGREDAFVGRTRKERDRSPDKKNRHGIAPLWSSSKKSSLCCPLYANVGREVRLGPNYHSRSGKLYGASYVPPPPSANSITTGINFSIMCAWYSMVKHENIGTSCNFNISPKAFCAPTSFPRFPLSPPHGRSNRRRKEAREKSIGRRRRGKESRSIKNWQLRERTATTAV